MRCRPQMPIWDLAAGADEAVVIDSPQLKMGGQLQGFAHSPGSLISVPSSSPGQLIKGTSLLREMNCTTNLHKALL